MTSNRIPQLSLIILFWLINLVNYAQLIELPNLELITEKEGLPFNSITDIVQDQKGFIWVSGPNGLARYDGYTFEVVPGKGRDKSTTGNIIISLATDEKGMIWAGSINGRVSRINPETLEITHYELFEKSTISFSNQVFGDKSGNVWTFSESVGLFKFDGESKFNFVGSLHNLPKAGLAAPSFYNRVVHFYEESPSIIWLASSNGLYKLHTGSGKMDHISVMSDNPNRPAFLNRIVPDGSTGFWCSTWGSGLMHIDTVTRQFKKYLFEEGDPGTSNIIHGLARKNDHELWISSRGLGVFNEETKAFSFYNDRKDYNTDLSSADILEAKTGIIWVVTDKGLMRWAPDLNKFTFYRLKVTRSDNFSYYGVSRSVVDPKTNRRIIGTHYADGLYVFTPDGKEIILPVRLHPNGEPYMLINDILIDSKGKVLVLSRDQLYELNDNNQLIRIDGPNQLLSPKIVPYFYRIIESSNGDYWLGSSRTGLFQFRLKDKTWKHYQQDSLTSIASNRVMNILEDDQKNIWTAHATSGISIFNPTENKWKYLKHQDNDSTSLVSNIFTGWTKTSTGKIAYASVEGISIIDPKTFAIKNLTERSGLTNQSVYSIQSDGLGNLWTINYSGLFVLTEDGREIKKFNSNEGIKGNYSTFSLSMEGENLFMYTYQGYYVLNPKHALKTLNVPVPIYITRINDPKDSLFTIPTSYNLDYDNNSASIEFAALNFMGEGNNQYRYIMEGLHKNWFETNSNRVNYSGIPSGNYTFRVQLVNQPESEASIKISVSTPFWKTLWFRIILVLTGLFGVYLVYRVRLVQIRAEAKLKSDFNKKLAEVEMKALKAQMSPHFIFNSLNSINRYIIKSEPEKASLYLTKFSKLIRLILDNSNSKIISLEQELNALKLYIELEALRFNEKFTYTLQIDPELNPMSIGVPPMIIQPFIENAIWHGLLHKETPGQLDIAIDRFGSGLKCVITDNGVGRKKAAELKSKSINQEKSYGMKITNERLTMLNGESKVSSVEILDLEDENGNALGTKVILKIMAAELEPEF